MIDSQQSWLEGFVEGGYIIEHVIHAGHAGDIPGADVYFEGGGFNKHEHHIVHARVIQGTNVTAE